MNDGFTEKEWNRIRLWVLENKRELLGCSEEGARVILLNSRNRPIAKKEATRDVVREALRLAHAVFDGDGRVESIGV